MEGTSIRLRPRRIIYALYYTISFICAEALEEFGLPEDGYLDKLLSAVRRRAA